MSENILPFAPTWLFSVNNSHISKTMKYSTKWILFIAAGIFAYDGSLGMLIPIIPFLLFQLHLNKTYLGLPLLLLGIGQIFGTVLFAYLLAKSKSRKIYLKTCFFILTAAGINYALLEKFLQLLISSFLQGLGTGMIWQMALVIITELFIEEKQAKINGYIFATFNIATIISPVYSTFIYGKNGSFGFGLSIAALGIVLLFSSLFCPEILKYHASQNNEKLSASQMKHPVFLSGIFLSFVSAGLRAGLESYIPLILQERFNMPEQYIGLFWLFITIPATISCLILGKVTNYVQEYYLLWIGMVFCCASIMLILFSQHIVLFCIGLVCLAIGFSYTSAPVPSFLVKTMKVHPSALHGFRNVFTALGIGLYPLFVGLMLEFFSLNGLALTFGMTVVICIPFLTASHKYLQTTKTMIQ